MYQSVDLGLETTMLNMTNAITNTPGTTTDCLSVRQKQAQPLLAATAVMMPAARHCFCGERFRNFVANALEILVGLGQSVSPHIILLCLLFVTCQHHGERVVQFGRFHIAEFKCNGRKGTARHVSDGNNNY